MLETACLRVYMSSDSSPQCEMSWGNVPPPSNAHVDSAHKPIWKGGTPSLRSATSSITSNSRWKQPAKAIRDVSSPFCDMEDRPPGPQNGNETSLVIKEGSHSSCGWILYHPLLEWRPCFLVFPPEAFALVMGRSSAAAGVKYIVIYGKMGCSAKIC